MGRDRQPLHLHAHDRVGVGLVFCGLVQLFLLTAEKARRVCPVGAVEPALPKVTGLHHVEIAIEDQKAVACHHRLLGLFVFGKLR